jgi:hypothetical protein
MKTKILILSIAATLPAAWAFAQDGERPPRPPGAPQDGERKNGPRDGERPPGPVPILFIHALDTDEDGILSADEIKGAPESLKKLDKNGDGKLTPDEYLPPRPGGPREDGAGAGKPAGPKDGERPKTGPRDGENKRPGKKDGDVPAGKEKAGTGKPPGEGERRQSPPPPLLEALDTDHDGVISAEEIANSSEALAKLDKNNDGQLGPREYAPKPPQGPPQEGKDGARGERPEAKPAN